ncbi:MAG: NifU family protein [Lachnospiraceae bacterium]|nr:NifU family protein [Lachnospiraceae bacterium]
MSMEQKVQEIEKILDEYVRPKLAEHEGNVDIAEYRDGIVYVRLTGHCSGCPSAKYTLESLIEEELMAHLPEVQAVKLQEEVSQELLDMAKAILAGKKVFDEE